MATSEPAPRAAPGEILAGKYQVERVLGQGGMGMVVAARHVQLGTRVALKFLLPTASGGEDAVKRFLREAQTASLIASEHITRVLDMGTLADGSPFIVMEYLEGRDLSSIVRQQGNLPILDAVDYTLQTCEALAVAHAAGIVHRDLKPANLFLMQLPDGSPHIKILDFGISKKHGLEGDFALTRTDSAIMGSPAYISPEQIRSQKSVDGRADIWSLGVSLYELLSGQLPFMAENLGGLIAAILADPAVPLRSRRPDVPPELEAAVHGCLEKSISARPANVAVLAQQLRPFGSAHGAAAADRTLGVVARTTGNLTAVQAASTTGAHAALPAPSPAGAGSRDKGGVTRPLGTLAGDRQSALPARPARRAGPSQPPPPAPAASAMDAARESGTEIYVAPPAASAMDAARESGTEIYVARAPAAPSPAAPPPRPPAAAPPARPPVVVPSVVARPPTFPPGMGLQAPAPGASAGPGAAPAVGGVPGSLPPVGPPGGRPGAGTLPGTPVLAAVSAPSVPGAPPVPAAAPMGAAAASITSGAWGRSSAAPTMPARSSMPLLAGIGGGGLLLVSVLIWLLVRESPEAASQPGSAPEASLAAATAAAPSAAPVEASPPEPTAEPAPVPSAAPTDSADAAPAEPSASATASASASAAPVPATAARPAPAGGAGARPRPATSPSSDLNKLIQSRK